LFLEDVTDLEYLRDALALGVSDEVAREKFTGLIYDALTTVTTQVWIRRMKKVDFL
jgi:hypothetical protein